jgi:malonyl-CoA/methylmalonyl-CoA synthetase
VSVRIARPEDGTSLARGEIGVIEVKGPNVFTGYWRNPAKTAEGFRADGYFITGDLGYVDTEGYVNISGRDKDLIITGGFNVYPAEVETLLDAIPGVAESAVIGVPHPDMGEAVVAVLSLAEPSLAGTLDEATVLSALAGRIARFKQPRRVLFLPELPRNTMGKIQKAQLRSVHADLFSAPAA